MNNKEFISELSNRTGLSQKDATARTNAVITMITEALMEEDEVSVVGFGNFEVRKKLERVVVNPTTKQRMLVPPKMVVGFFPERQGKQQIRLVFHSRLYSK